MSTRLKRDAVPTLDNTNEGPQIENSLSDRERRKVLNSYKLKFYLQYYLIVYTFDAVHVQSDICSLLARILLR